MILVWFYVDIMANQLKQRDLLSNIFMEKLYGYIVSYLHFDF